MLLLEHVSLTPDRIASLAIGVFKHQGLVAVFVIIIIKVFVHVPLECKFGHRLLAIPGVHKMRPCLDDFLEELAYGLEHFGSTLMMRLYQCLPSGQPLEYEGDQRVLVHVLEIHEAQFEVLDC